MNRKQSRLEFLRSKKSQRTLAFEELSRATKMQGEVTPEQIKLAPESFRGKKAIVIGSGVGGLSTAFELLAQNTGMEVIVLEASGRTGGRCLTLRTGDTLTEDVDRKLKSTPGPTQTVRFDRPAGDTEPYLNAGPGRIPSAHKRVLSYLQRFGVDLEVYLMNSESNLVQMQEGPLAGKPLPYRRINHNTRGWLAQTIYERADEFIDYLSQLDPAKDHSAIDEKYKADRVEQLKSLMVSFGDLDANGRYEVTAGENGYENGRSRAGYSVLPGVEAGEVDEPLSFDDLLGSEFWARTKFYQPVDFLWQPTMFQPVGGMDRVQHALAQKVAEHGGTVHLNSPVSKIDWDERNSQFRVEVEQIGVDKRIVFDADYVFSNVPMPFLKGLLSDRLMTPGSNGFLPQFKESLNAVFEAQFKKHSEDEHVELFLACTTKVGWQANRRLWQGSLLDVSHAETDGEQTQLGVPKSEVGVVPIFGGISWTEHPITQIWYPSSGFHDRRGILTGCYNFGEEAFNDGINGVRQRLDDARDGAALFGNKFAGGLENGVAIAWQNMPHIKGGWAQWHVLGEDGQGVQFFNELVQGTTVDGNDAGAKFFIVGDQVSSLPGWQEGAIASAINALCRLSNWKDPLLRLESLPDTRLMVEGI